MENKFAENLSKLRKLHRLSQAELAEKIDATQATIASYEGGLREPRVHRLIKIAKVFDVSLDELVYGDFEILAAAPQKTMGGIFCGKQIR